MTSLEFCQPTDPHLDYCLWPYAPPRGASGKLRSASLLWHFLDSCCVDTQRLRACCEALRQGLGPFSTVWGIKKRGEAFSFEFYFYDYARLERRVSVERVLAILAPFVGSTLRVPRERPYFMFSLDLDDAMMRQPAGFDHLNLYIGNPGSAVSSGIAYKVTRDGFKLDNLYYFFETATQRDDIEAKVACSAHLDLRGVDLASILWPEMVDASQIVVVANKQMNDGVYFSRMPVDPFIDFVARVAFSRPLETFLRANRDALDHLLFDVGFDYVARGTRAVVTKTAIYGVF